MTNEYLVIVGPTASGKTNLSIKLAQVLNGEIIAADSRTVYKEMDIGTAKPTKKEQSQVRHYCLDLVEPNISFTVADFAKEAKKSIKSIQAKAKLPIIVGGSGLFVDALIYGFDFVRPNEKLREQYKDYSVDQLKSEIFRLGLELPENHNNKRYLQNTLERQGRQGTKQEIDKNAVIVGINPTNDVLLENIAQRSANIINTGVLEEAKVLFRKYGSKCNAFNGGIYKILRDVNIDNIDRNWLEQKIIKSDKQLAKKQITWFKRNKKIKWFNDIDTAYNWVVKRFM